MKLLLHICCGNCAVHPVSTLRSRGESIAGFWFNPNIHPLEEHTLRRDSLKRLSDEWKFDVLYYEYRPDDYFGMLNLTDFRDWNNWNSCTGWNSSNGPIPSAPERCSTCYLLRLEKTAQEARAQGFDAFSTTLLISPYQDFSRIVTTGEMLAGRYNIMFYQEDFRPHFREAMAKARGLGLYRQKYCGCIFSKKEKDQRVKLAKAQRGKGNL